jgi:hypothetical protein
VTQKFLDDKYYGNHAVAVMGGLNLEEMNELEQQFLEILEFDLFISEQEFVAYR